MLLNSCKYHSAIYKSVIAHVLTAQFYALDHGTGNLELLARFFDKHPGYADKVFLSVKVRFCRLPHVHLILTDIIREA